MRRIQFVVIGCLLAFIATASADLSQYVFVDSAEEARFKSLISELRCLVCQNQSLLDSDAGLAQDLRFETYKLMKSGKTDGEVINFLVDRYGDFVLYRPPFKASTYFLWLGPFALLLIMVVVVLRAIKRQGKTKAPLTADEEQQLDELLAEKDKVS